MRFIKKHIINAGLLQIMPDYSKVETKGKVNSLLSSSE